MGVDDKTREITGIDLAHLDEVERFVRELSADSIKPPVSLRTFRMELPDATGQMRPVLKVEVDRSLFVHRSPGGYFERVGSSKREPLPDALARLFQQRSQARIIRFDEQVVPQTSPADLDVDLWQRFVSAAGASDPEVLRKLRLLAFADNGVEEVTVAGVLMATRTPERWLPHATLLAVRYAHTEQDSNYQTDAKEIIGPLDVQIAEVFSFVRRNSEVRARKVAHRVETPQYSERAVFEAIVNAVAHRDYSLHGQRIRIFMFRDRLEVRSPGALPSSLTVENLALRQSTRNELIASLLGRCPAAGDVPGRSFVMDKRGDGVPIMNAEADRLGVPRPTFVLIDGCEFIVTLYPVPESPAFEEEDVSESEFDEARPPQRSSRD